MQTGEQVCKEKQSHTLTAMDDDDEMSSQFHKRVLANMFDRPAFERAEEERLLELEREKELRQCESRSGKQEDSTFNVAAILPEGNALAMKNAGAAV